MAVASVKVHNPSSTGVPCTAEAETEGLFSGSLEVVIRTDGRHWNPLMAATFVPKEQKLRPRQLEQSRNRRDHVAFTNTTVEIKQTDLITGFPFFIPGPDTSVLGFDSSRSRQILRRTRRQPAKGKRRRRGKKTERRRKKTRRR